MSGGIFICYRRDDSSGFARGIYDRLARRLGRGNVFFDVDNIAPGLDFFDILSERVGICDALIAVIGRNWVSATDEDNRRRLDDPDDFVRIEIEAALGRDIRVIPVLVDDAAMPKPDDLPDTLKKLARRQGIKISHDRFDADVRKLTRTLLLLQVELREREAVAATRLAREEREKRETAAKAEEGERARLLAEAEAHREEEERRRREAAVVERTAQEERENREAAAKVEEAERTRLLAEAEARREEEERRRRQAAVAERTAQEEREKREGEEEKAEAEKRAREAAEAELAARKEQEGRGPTEKNEPQQAAATAAGNLPGEVGNAVFRARSADAQRFAVAAVERRQWRASWLVIASVAGLVILGAAILIAELGRRQSSPTVVAPEPTAAPISGNARAPVPSPAPAPKPVGQPEVSINKIAPAVPAPAGVVQAERTPTGTAEVAPSEPGTMPTAGVAPSQASPTPKAPTYVEADAQIRSELAHFGVIVDPLAHGFSATIPATSTDSGRILALLSRLGGVVSLKAESIPTNNFEPVSGLAGLQNLNLRKTQIVDLGPLRSLSSLQSLDLWETPVMDLSPLKGLSALKNLDLAATKVADLSPLKGLSALKNLDLAATKVADLSPLKGLTALQNLDVSETFVPDLKQIQDLPSLTQLSASVDEKERHRFLDYRSTNGLRPVEFY